MSPVTLIKRLLPGLIILQNVPFFKMFYVERLFRPDLPSERRYQCLSQVGPLSSHPDRHSLCLTDKVIYWIFYQNILTSYNYQTEKAELSTDSGFLSFHSFKCWIRKLSLSIGYVKYWSIEYAGNSAEISNKSSLLLWQYHNVSLSIWQTWWRYYKWYIRPVVMSLTTSPYRLVFHWWVISCRILLWNYSVGKYK